MRVSYDRFQIQEIEIKSTGGRVNIKWTERHDADENQADYIEKWQRESTYASNSRIFKLVQALWPFVSSEMVNIKKLKVKDYFDTFEDLQLEYLSNRGSLDPDTVKTPKMDIDRLDNALKNGVSIDDKEYSLMQLLEAIKMNCFEFCVQDTKFPPSAKTVNVNTDTGEVF